MILAAGVAAGQILGGLVVSAHLLAAAWRPALLINVPVGATLLLVCRGALPETPRREQERLDIAGVALIAATLLAFIVPLTLGRDQGWPAWVWGSLAASGLGAAAFVAFERRASARGSRPLFDLGVLELPGVGPGALAVALVMACYAGFLLALTLHLQTALGFSPLHAGLIFALYATGFGTASLTWTRLPRPMRHRLPIAGPLLMGATLLAIGALANDVAWALVPSIPLLLAAGAGHAWAFAPLVEHLSTTVSSRHAADLSGLIITADWIGTVLGVAVFTGVYLSAARHGSAGALELTCIAIAVALLATTACASRALSRGGGRLADFSGVRARNPDATAP
jgi:MFS family permease